MLSVGRVGWETFGAKYGKISSKGKKMILFFTLLSFLRRGGEVEVKKRHHYIFCLLKD